MNTYTEEYHTPALGLVTNYRNDGDAYVARTCLKGGATTYQIAASIRPGEKGGVVVGWQECTLEQFCAATNTAKDTRFFKVGDVVDYIGQNKRGPIQEIKDGRARVAWAGRPRTWVRFQDLRKV